MRASFALVFGRSWFIRDLNRAPNDLSFAVRTCLSKKKRWPRVRTLPFFGSTRSPSEPPLPPEPRGQRRRGKNMIHVRIAVRINEYLNYYCCRATCFGMCLCVGVYFHVWVLCKFINYANFLGHSKPRPKPNQKMRVQARIRIPKVQNVEKSRGEMHWENSWGLKTFQLYIWHTRKSI